MFRSICSIFALLIIITSCETSSNAQEIELPETSLAIKQIDSTTYTYSWQSNYKHEQAIINNIQPPKGYVRLNLEEKSFQSWLNHLPINKTDNTVYTYTGEKKYNQNAQFSVLDIDIGNKDLQQCADAVMRLRAEYLYAQKAIDQIHFNYTNGVEIGFEKWSNGYYPSLKRNKVVWVNSETNNTSYKSFKKYMNNIFTYAGTASLSKELINISIDQIKAGDVFIRGGFPGHAVIVVDVTVNNETNDKCFLIAQSYMPAQNIHILKNPDNSSLSPWYSVSECRSVIETPEWTFYPNQLKRFK